MTDLQRYYDIVDIIARRFKVNAVCDYDDYKQVGYIAMLNSLKLYDPTKGDIEHYLRKAVKQNIVKEFVKFSKGPITITYNDSPIQEDDDFEEIIPDSLTERQYKILLMRVQGYTLENIGDSFFKTKEWARQQLETIYQKIQEANE